MNGNGPSGVQFWAVVILVIKKSDDREAGVLFLITSMITDRIGRHENLSVINQNHDKI